MKPILFNTEMVRAILDGRKTVTRRIIKFPTWMNEEPDEFGEWTGYSADGAGQNTFGIPRETLPELIAPYRKGDILYVRETWQEVFETEYDSEAPGYCKNIREQILNWDDLQKAEAGMSTEWSCAAMAPRMKYYVFKTDNFVYAQPDTELKWRPSIHMPKEAARIFLRVTNVRVERVQNMTIPDIVAEGAYEDCRECIECYSSNGNQCCAGEADECNKYDDARCTFVQLWNSTVKPSDLDRLGWSANPWVWVYEFERAEKPEEALKNG